MTIAEIVEAALARASDFGANFPSTRSVLYRRIGQRLQQLYAVAARTNPEYFGVSAVGTLSSGAVSLSTTGDPDAGDPVFSPELITRVEIADKGTSAYTNGDEVFVVQRNDPGVAVAPRVTIRNGVIQQIGTDLTNVTSLRMYYSRRPFRLDGGDGALALDFPEAFQELLVVDLAKWLARKLADKENRGLALEALTAEETELLANFVAEVESYTSGVETGRFGRTVGATHQ